MSEVEKQVELQDDMAVFNAERNAAIAHIREVISGKLDEANTVFSLQETIRTQQAEIERVTEQRDRLLKVATSYRLINQCGSPSCQINVVSTCKCTNCVSDRLDALIAEIEESKCKPT